MNILSSIFNFKTSSSQQLGVNNKELQRTIGKAGVDPAFFATSFHQNECFHES